MEFRLCSERFGLKAVRILCACLYRADRRFLCFLSSIFLCLDMRQCARRGFMKRKIIV